MEISKENTDSDQDMIKEAISSINNQPIDQEKIAEEDVMVEEAKSSLNQPSEKVVEEEKAKIEEAINSLN